MFSIFAWPPSSPSSSSSSSSSSPVSRAADGVQGDSSHVERRHFVRILNTQTQPSETTQTSNGRCFVFLCFLCRRRRHDFSSQSFAPLSGNQVALLRPQIVRLRQGPSEQSKWHLIWWPQSPEVDVLYITCLTGLI